MKITIAGKEFSVRDGGDAELERYRPIPLGLSGTLSLKDVYEVQIKPDMSADDICDRIGEAIGKHVDSVRVEGLINAATGFPFEWPLVIERCGRRPS